MLKYCRTRTAWLRRRQKGIGASESAALFDCGFGSPYSVWAEKIGPQDMRRGLDKISYVHWGKIHEPIIAAEYKRVMYARVTNPGAYTIHQHNSIPCMFATLDRIIDRIIDRQDPGVLEIKTANSINRKLWGDDLYVEKNGFPIYDGSGKNIPINYQIQVQHQMDCANMRWGHLAVLIDNDDFRIYHIERNQKFIDVLEKKCIEFWALVESKTPPPVDGRQCTTDAIRALFPQDNGERIMLPDNFIDLDAERCELKSSIKALSKRLDKIDNQIKAAIGENTYGELPGCVYKCSTQIVKEHFVKEFTKRQLTRSEKK